MNYQQLQTETNILQEDYELQLYKLRRRYVDTNKKFSVGDFLYNVTGIIKVDKITYEIWWDELIIKYAGLPYKKLHGKIIRTKCNKPRTMREQNVNKLEYYETSN